MKYQFIVFALFFNAVILLAFISGVLNDYPEYESIPNLKGSFGKGWVWFVVTLAGIKSTIEGVKEKLGNIKEGVKGSYQSYTRDNVLTDLNEWKSKILQDIESLWDQLAIQLEHQKTKIEANTNEDEDVSTKLHKLFGKLMPNYLLPKDTPDVLSEYEKIAVVDVSGCSADNLAANISEDKRLVTIQGHCEITDGDRILFSKNIDERIRIPSKTNLEKVSAGLKNGLLCLLFPAYEKEVVGEVLPIDIQRW